VASSAINNAFERIDGAYGTGGRLPADPFAPETRFSSARTFDKLIGLVILALVSGAVGYLVVPAGIAFGCVVVALGLTLLTWWRMRLAKYVAPAYSVCEGLALGAISAAYASYGHGIIPTAIAFTGAVFIGCLVSYRTGLVRVTPRMVTLAFMGGLGIMAVFVLSLLGLSLPGLGGVGPLGFLIGVLCLGIAVLNLFTDFEWVARSEAAGVSAEAEWAAAFAMMTALVLVYISILRMLGAMYGGRRR
jgi:uncharacterized YccA/Bax inhibitor family protein